MSNITPIKQRPVQEVVEELEDALELAKAGELRNVAIVGERSSGDQIYTSWGLENNMVLIGMLDRVKHRIHAAIDEGTGE